MKTSKRHLIYLCISSILIILDQYTKYLATTHLMGEEGITLIPGILSLYYLENRGAAFGMLQNAQVFFILFTIIGLTVLLYTYLKLPDTRYYLPLRILLLLIFSGAIGNFIDRIKNGFVVDFFQFTFINFPIFNVADIYVTVSVIILILLILFYYKDEDFDCISLGGSNGKSKS